MKFKVQWEPGGEIICVWKWQAENRTDILGSGHAEGWRLKCVKMALRSLIKERQIQRSYLHK